MDGLMKQNSTASSAALYAGPRKPALMISSLPFGEMVSLLCAANNPDAAVRLEQLWNYLSLRHRFSLHCAHSLSSLHGEPDTLLKICAEHALAIPSEAAV